MRCAPEFCLLAGRLFVADDIINLNRNAAKMRKLPKKFYLSDNVTHLASQLLGKLLVTNFKNKTTIGRIVETEAYAGVTDRASHAYGGRRTRRTEIMYSTGGVAYVYLCYGINHLFNVVTSARDTPHAVLIRALEPIAGIEHMLTRTNKKTLNYSITSGPGNLSKAMGINTKFSGESLLGEMIFLAEDKYILPKKNIISSARIGVDYAGDDAKLKYRFYIKDNKFVSKTRKSGLVHETVNVVSQR